MNKKGTYSFTKLYIGVAIMVFVIGFGSLVMVSQSVENQDLSVNIYNNSGVNVNLSAFDSIREDLSSNIGQMENESKDYDLGALEFIELPIRYISTIAKLLGGLPSILNDITTSVIGMLNLGKVGTLIKSLLFMLSGLFIVMLIVRIWKNMNEV